MQKLKYTGPHSAVEIEVAPRKWVTVERDGTIEAPKALADSLLEQADNWQQVGKPAEKKSTDTDGPEAEEK